ncbi:MAG TPA: disulfide bond formation protein B [Rhodocyclaceae bacterium]|nr:disulfide bond formation protein B [Rhodocyclaceae bacterium]
MRRSNSLGPNRLFALLAIVGVGMVVAALVLAKMYRLAACPLCILQRMEYLALALAALFALILPRCKLSQSLAALGCIAATGAGTATAGYQVWLQRFAQDVSCTADTPWWEQLVDWAGEKIPALFGASGLCSEPGWKFLSLSIADWSAIAFTVLFLVSVVALIKRLRS